MSRLFSLFGDTDDKEHAEKDTVEEAKLSLRKEELDIKKNRFQKGDVEISKEIIEEKKVVDVPINHEEVVIERRSINNEACDSPICEEETIRIPVSEEKVQVDKHTVITGEVSATKHVVEDTEHIEETLRREEARVNKTGDADVISDDTIHSDLE